MFPWIPFLFEKRKRLSDIEFLSIKEFDGKLVKNDSVRTTVGDLATLTASSGKDMYVGTATISGYDIVNNAVSVVVLKINGTEVERFTHVASTEDNNFTYEFKTKGKVAATEIIKIEWITEGDTGTIAGAIQCFEETTGASPQV